MKIKINKNIIEYLIILIITCIIFIPFLTGHYATDTYNIYEIGYKEYAIKWSLNDGRTFMAIIVLIAEKLKLSIECFTFITLFIAIIISSISVIILKNIIEKYKKTKNLIQEIIIIVISYLTIFNFMYIDNMYFVESIVMAISILLFIISADILVEKNKKALTKSLILTVIGILFYQGSIGIYFMMVIFISIIKNKNNVKKIILDVLESGIIGLVAIAINLILVTIVGKIYNMKQTRIGTINMIIPNILKTLEFTPVILIKTCDLYPIGLYLIYVVVIILTVIIYFKLDKKADSLAIKLLTIFIMGILCSSMTFALSFTSFYTGRLRLTIGETIAMMFAIIYTETNMFEEKNIKKVIIFFLITYLISTLGSYTYLMQSHKKVNELEKKESQEIKEYIENYEKENNLKVDKISKIKIPNKTEQAYYEEVSNQSNLTYTALRSDLAIKGAIEFYTKRNFKETKINSIEQEQIAEIISRKNNGKTYICINDTLFVEIFMF